MKEKKSGKKSSQRSVVNKEGFTHTQVGMLIESFQNEFKAFGEGLQNLQDKVEFIAITQAKTQETIEKMDVRLISVEKRLDSIEKRMDSIENRMSSLEKEIQSIKEALKTTVNEQEIIRLNKRIDLLEKKVSYLETQQNHA